MKTNLVIGMAGSGGDGIVSAGESLIAAAALDGYSAIMTKSFGSQIRGGESSFRLRISTEPIYNPGGALDVAVALNWPDFLRFGGELPVTRHTVVIYEAAAGIEPADIPLTGVKPEIVMAVPIAAMAKETGGSERAKNSVVLGLMAGWFRVAPASLRARLLKKFGKKGADVVEKNERAFDAGVEYAREHPLPGDPALAPPRQGAVSPLLTDGNDMCGAAAIFAGCRFFSGYPITPSTEIMQFLGNEIWKHGGSMLQAEDEIAGIGAVVGASFAGLKSMTATSGPGLALKTEILGLATIAEIPLVCVNVQRGGPSTGLPTKSEQADLFQSVFSAHGDVVRPVLAPISVRDTFGVTVEAFNLAEKYQTPVLVLSDQEISQRKETVAPIDTRVFTLEERREPVADELTNYARFRLTESGVSPMSHPGMPGGNYLASGIEHNEEGAPTASGAIHARMNEKRIRKLDPLKQRRDLFQIEGDKDAPLALISWGSVAGVAIEAFEIARREGIPVKLMVPRLLYPISEKVFEDFLSTVHRGLVVEQSHQGQFYLLLRMFVDVPRGVESLRRSGSNPITAQEIVDRLRGMAASLETARVLEGQWS